MPSLLFCKLFNYSYCAPSLTSLLLAYNYVILMLYKDREVLKMKKELRCKRCKHIWFSEIHPKACPDCHNRYWDKEYSRSDLLVKAKYGVKQ